MATELAKAYVQIVPSAQGISGSIQKVLDPEASVAGESFGGKLVGTIKKVLATAAIGKALSTAISEGAALEQSLGGIETLFKESADKVKANAAQAYKTAGMSANEYMELTTSFSASLLSSLSNDTAKATDVADMPKSSLIVSKRRPGLSRSCTAIITASMPTIGHLLRMQITVCGMPDTTRGIQKWDTLRKHL